MAFGNDAVTSSSGINLNEGQADAILKEVYSDDGVTNQFFTENPFLALMPKKEDVTGRFFEQPVWASAGQAQSRIFTNLQTNAGNTGEAPYTYLVPKVENMAVANVSTKLILESSSSKGAFVDMVRAIADNQMQQLINDTSLSLFRTSVPWRAQVGGSVASTTLTFTNVADAVSFELNMFLDFTNGITSGTSVTRALASNNTACQITAIDYVGGTATVKWLGTGTQTLTANNVQVGDYIFRAGDTNVSGVGATAIGAIGANGFQDWIVYGGPGSGDSFLGVNRTAQPVRLAGSWLDGTAGNLEEVLEKAINQVARFGGKLTHFVMPYGQYTALSNAQGAKVQLVTVKGSSGESEIGFEGIEVTGANGRVVCLPDRYCPSNTICGVNINTWKLISVGKAVHTFQEDGKVWLRSYNQQGMEIRFYSLANLVCREPRANCNIRVASIV
jgi:hypothetical protein